MVLMELRPILEVHDTDIENYAMVAYKEYVNSQNRSFDECARMVIEETYGEDICESIGEEEIDALVALMAEETIRSLTYDNKPISNND